MTAISARNAWAVGDAGDKTLILRWNGSGWLRTASPAPGSGSHLSDVAATSSHSAWAVGGFDIGTGFRPLFIHCC